MESGYIQPRLEGKVHKNDKRSELLILLNNRKAWNFPEYRTPTLSEEYLMRAGLAVRCVQELEDSDPFAGARMASHLRQGLDLPSEVLKECSGRRGIRSREPVSSVVKVALEPVKKGLDADRAWNQHHSARFLEEKVA